MIERRFIYKLFIGGIKTICTRKIKNIGSFILRKRTRRVRYQANQRRNEPRHMGLVTKLSFSRKLDEKLGGYRGEPSKRSSCEEVERVL